MPFCVPHACRYMYSILNSGVAAPGGMLYHLYVIPDAAACEYCCPSVTPGTVALHSAGRVSLWPTLSSTARYALKALTMQSVVMRENCILVLTDGVMRSEANREWRSSTYSTT